MVYTGRRCWLCGRNGSRDPLDKHHIFGGVAYRDKSEHYGLTVDLCHDRCHENGTKAAHRCRATADALRAYGQRKAMVENGWNVEQFRLQFGKNWLSEEELAEVEAEIAGEEMGRNNPSVGCADTSPYTGEALKVSGFVVLPVIALPF